MGYFNQEPVVFITLCRLLSFVFDAELEGLPFVAAICCEFPVRVFQRRSFDLVDFTAFLNNPVIWDRIRPYGFPCSQAASNMRTRK